MTTFDVGDVIAAKYEFTVRLGQGGMGIKSPHVARVLDVGTASGVPFIVMDRLVGHDLRALLEAREDPMPIDQTADLLLQACEAINEAHSLGIIHRDLKPANLFVTTGADALPLVKVLDFGIANSSDADDPGRTATRGVMGSPLYTSPEQLTA